MGRTATETAARVPDESGYIRRRRASLVGGLRCRRAGDPADADVVDHSRPTGRRRSTTYLPPGGDVRRTGDGLSGRPVTEAAHADAEMVADAVGVLGLPPGWRRPWWLECRAARATRWARRLLPTPRVRHRGDQTRCRCSRRATRGGPSTTSTRFWSATRAGRRTAVPLLAPRLPRLPGNSSSRRSSTSRLHQADRGRGRVRPRHVAQCCSPLSAISVTRTGGRRGTVPRRLGARARSPR